MTTRRRRRRRTLARQVIALALLAIVVGAVWVSVPHNVLGAAGWLAHVRDRTSSAVNDGVERAGVDRLNDAPPASPPARQPARVVAVVDATTVVVQPTRLGALPKDQHVRVRLLQLTVPRCYAAAAVQRTRRLLAPGSAVELEADRPSTTPAGQPLRYVWAGRRLINEQLVRVGAGQAQQTSTGSRYLARIRTAQAAAKSQHLGLWGSACAPSPRT